MVKLERHVVERKGPTACVISFLVGFITDLCFRRIILKCDHEPNTKSVQDAVIQTWGRVEGIPEGPLEGGGCERNKTTMQNSQDFR